MLSKEIIVLEKGGLCESCVNNFVKETEPEGNVVHYGEPESESLNVFHGERLGTG